MGNLVWEISSPPNAFYGHLWPPPKPEGASRHHPPPRRTKLQTHPRGPGVQAAFHQPDPRLTGAGSRENLGKPPETRPHHPCSLPSCVRARACPHPPPALLCCRPPERLHAQLCACRRKQPARVYICTLPRSLRWGRADPKPRVRQSNDIHERHGTDGAEKDEAFKVKTRLV